MAKKKNKYDIIKKMDKKVLIFVALFLVLGIACGAITMFMLTKNDQFTLVGESEIFLNVGDEYVEQYAKAVAFGNDISKDIKTKGDVDTTKEGTYIVTYWVENFRYNNYKLYRKIVVKENIND